MSEAVEAHFEKGEVYLSLVVKAKGKLELWIYIHNKDISLAQVEDTVRKHFCDSPLLVFKEVNVIHPKQKTGMHRCIPVLHFTP